MIYNMKRYDMMYRFFVFFSPQIWCRAVHVLCQYFTVCNFFWMFCEGLYLNTIMVFAFNSSKIVIPTCYVVGWGKYLTVICCPTLSSFIPLALTRSPDLSCPGAENI